MVRDACLTSDVVFKRWRCPPICLPVTVLAWLLLRLVRCLAILAAVTGMSFKGKESPAGEPK